MCERCNCTEGYDLPGFEVVWHEVVTDHSKAIPDRDGQGRMFKDVVYSLSEAAAEKRDSLPTRLAKMLEIIGEAPADHFLLWHSLEDERHAILKAVPTAVAIYGTQDLDERERAISAFADGDVQYLAAKSVMLSCGVNLQHHCHRAIFVGIDFKFHDFLQACHRIHRFQQQHPVRIDLIYTEAERTVKKALEEKWARYDRQVTKMSGLIREYGMANIAHASTLQRTMGVPRQEVHGEHFHLINNDSVLETHAMPSASVGLIVTSIPFSSQYEYTPCYDQETEVLTKRGWLSFGELVLEDHVATLNPETLQVEWQKPSEIIWRKYTGPMVHFYSRNSFDLLVTPDHKMFFDTRVGNHKTRRKERVLTFVHAKTAHDFYIHRKWSMVAAAMPGEGNAPDYIDIPRTKQRMMPDTRIIERIKAADFMQLAGWYLSEGHCRPATIGKRGAISISQTAFNPTFRQEIIDLFSRIGIPANTHHRTNIVAWDISLATFLGQEFGLGSSGMKIPRWVKDLHPDLLCILRDTMMKGDGNKTGYAYTSYSKELCNDFQELCFLTGWRTSVCGNVVRIGQQHIYPEVRNRPSIKPGYSGMIGCATVPNHTLVVRRNGTAIVSGNSFNDFGHSDDNEHFWRQMDFLTPELVRVLQPGRVAAIHVKDRIAPGGLTGLGFQTLQPFHAEAIFHYQKHGLKLIAIKTITTDVVRENNQTYRLGWTEQCKDGSRMGCGVPEYVLLFRKPPTDATNGYADVPIIKAKPDTETPDGMIIPYDYDAGKIVPGTGYSRARWQLDAHGYTRSSGNRLLTSDELLHLPHADIYKRWREESTSTVYDFERHVALGEILEREKRLPSTFMLMPPHSVHPDIWSDIARMRTLNMEQERKGQEFHLCPMQFDTAERLITQLSMPGEIVYDPFAGIGTVPYMAIKLQRFGLGVELNARYWKDSVQYCKEAEKQQNVPTLFDLMTLEVAATEGLP